MSKPQNAYRTVDEIVREYLIEAGESTLHKYGRTLTLALSGLRDLNMDVSGVPKEVTISILSNNTVPLPDDFIKEAAVGVLDVNGNILYMSENSKMALPRTYDDCGNLQKNATDLDDENDSGGILFPGTQFRNGEYLGKNYGIGGGGSRAGYYRFDYANNYVALQALNTDFSFLYLRYLADINSVNGEYVVPPYVVESLKAFIYWKSIQKDRYAGRGEKLDAKEEYKSQKKLSKKRFGSFTIKQAADAMRRGNKLAPRF